MVLRAYASSWAAWIFLLVGLFISFYPTIYFTPVGRLFSEELANIIGARTFFLTAGSFIAVTGAAALLRNRRWKGRNIPLLLLFP